MTSLSSPGWRAHPDCPEHLRYILEKTVNAYPIEWLDEPATGEVFISVDECKRRLIAYSLSQGFDIVISRSTKTPHLAVTFSCCHHGKKTRNTRKLPPMVERDEEGEVIGAHRRDVTVVRQTDCPWVCKLSYKSIGKRGSGEKGLILTIKSLSHGDTHPLASNPLVYQRHVCQTA